MQRFSVVGLSHKFAPLEIRECLAINDATLPLALRMLRETLRDWRGCHRLDLQPR